MLRGCCMLCYAVLLTVILLLASNVLRTYRSTRQDLPTPCSSNTNTSTGKAIVR